jgi:hypothetical protein
MGAFEWLIDFALLLITVCKVWSVSCSRPLESAFQLTNYEKNGDEDSLINNDFVVEVFYSTTSLILVKRQKLVDVKTASPTKQTNAYTPTRYSVKTHGPSPSRFLFSVTKARQASCLLASTFLQSLRQSQNGRSHGNIWFDLHSFKINLLRNYLLNFSNDVYYKQ